MISSINSNISSLQLLRAQSAFNQAKHSPKEQELPVEQEQIIEEISAINPSSTVEIMQEKVINEIRNDLMSINNDITDEDIRYGLTFGRSVLIDYSA